jgi:glycosyltransferase involved in cell wall biosynthesis
VADRIADYSFERLRQNLTLANSQWTAAGVKRLLDIDAQVLYPPVANPAADVAWQNRRAAFLAVGRLSPEKEYERLMRILARVRRDVPELTLTIVGTWDRFTWRYMREVKRQAAALGSWIVFRQNLTRDDVRNLMASSRYGIHGMREEHFGMAPAEMVRAGMIVWVPRGGGQVEIIGDEPALLYEDEQEAAEKILQVLGRPAEQQRLREHLREQAAMFGTDRFVDEMRSIVATFRS